MICCVVRIKALAGRGDEFVRLFAEYAEVVKANEPGALLYSLNRDRETPDLFWAVEMYEDQAALDLHAANFQRLVSTAGHPVDGPPVFQTFDTAAGFLR